MFGFIILTSQQEGSCGLCKIDAVFDHALIRSFVAFLDGGDPQSPIPVHSVSAKYKRKVRYTSVIRVKAGRNG